MISNTFRILYLKNLIQFNFRKFLRVFFKKYYTVTWHNLSTRQIFTDVVFSKGSKLNKNIVIIFFNRNSLDGFWKGGEPYWRNTKKTQWHSDAQTRTGPVVPWPSCPSFSLPCSFHVQTYLERSGLLIKTWSHIFIFKFK